jgi:uncharacterized membrane protein (DUF485 family)
MEAFLGSVVAFFRELDGISGWATLVAVAGTLISFLALFTQSVFSANRPKTHQGNPQEELEKLVSGDESVDFSRVDFEDHTRLDELRVLQNRYQKQARRNSLAFNLLVFVQYVVGAVLATSFFPGSQSATLGGQQFTIGGLLGLIVLISTAIQQRYRPDILATQAKNRLTRCGRMIREIENGVFRIKTNSEDAPSLIELRESASRGIDDLEALELSGMESYYVQRLEIVAQTERKTIDAGVKVVTQPDRPQAGTPEDVEAKSKIEDVPNQEK